jgi:hypothetical protein
VHAAGRELQVRARSRDGEEHAVVAIVIGEPPDLRQPEAVAVEADDLVEPVGVSRDTKLHPRVV